jgi:hypothetical protein
MMRTLLYIAAVAAGAIVAGVVATMGVASCSEQKMSGDSFLLIWFAGAALAAWVLWGGGPNATNRFPHCAWLGCVFLTGVAIWMSVRQSKAEAELREVQERARESPEWRVREMSLYEGVDIGRSIHCAAWVLAGISIANVVVLSLRRRAAPPP